MLLGKQNCWASKKRFCGSFLQEASHDEATEVDEQARPTTQQMTFDLASLRASFKRKREDAEAMHVDAPGSKKGRFEAASLQVSKLYL